jgi:hypothetical protein
MDSGQGKIKWKNCKISSRMFSSWFRNKLDPACQYRTGIMLQPKNQKKVVLALGTVLLATQEQTSATKEHRYKLLCSLFTLVDRDYAISKETRPWNKYFH